MSDNENAPVSAPAVASPKRWKRIGVLAVVAGIVAAVVGLVGVLTGGAGLDPIDFLLFAGGMLLSVLGIRGMRQARKL